MKRDVDGSTPAGARPIRKPYEPPRLSEYGDVAKLTQATTGFGLDLGILRMMMMG